MITKLNEPLLVVEDSNEDFRILQRLMRRMAVQNPIYRCTNGDEVLEFLYQEGNYQDPNRAPRPSVILLDLNLPGIDGRDILERLKQDSSLRKIPIRHLRKLISNPCAVRVNVSFLERSIVVFTTSSNPTDIELCYQKGANGYLIKPINVQELQKTIQAFVNYWLEANTLSMTCE